MPEVDPVIEAAVKQFQLPPERGLKDLWPALFLAGLIYWAYGSLLSAGVVLALLVLKDVVRFALMTGLEAPDQDLLLLPLVKAVRTREVPAWKDGVIVLAGMAVVLVSSVACLIYDRAAGTETSHSLLVATIGLNIFTVLPLYPYDGWRLLNITLFARSPMLEMLLVVLTSLVVALLAFAIKAWVLLGFSAMTLLGFGVINRQRRVVTQLSDEGFPQAPWDEPTVRRLAGAVAAVFKSPPTMKPEMATQALVVWMRRVAKKLLTRPPSLPASLALLVGYASIGVYLIIALVFSSR